MKRDNQRKRNLLELVLQQLVLNRMDLEFGVIDTYFIDKGFGYIKKYLGSSYYRRIYFHISTVKKTDIKTFEKLHSYRAGELITLWYALKMSANGMKAVMIVNTEDLKYLLENKLVDKLLKNKYGTILRNIWNNSELDKPFWLDEISSIFIQETELDELRSRNFEKIQEKNEIEESRKAAEEDRKRQREIESHEFESLIEEVKSKGFTTSAQVSHYIIRNRLGDKYKHISGVLTMENDDSTWHFNGGFPPRIFAELCLRLNLSDNGSHSRVVGFTLFKDL